ncbi:MAG TPA: undecaprenyl-diphosphate phosphatase [Bacillota bacterium]|nr:undecaprenyl-diphosphate phosphatase [Bacillota bacterium]
MTLIESIILGLVQGLSEFLPISSSGHLAILQHFFGIEGESVLAFAVLLHLGTLISLVAVYYRVIWELIIELFASIKDLVTGKGLQINKNETRKLGVMIVVATIPTGLMGVFFNDFFAGLYNSVPAIGFCLIITGCFLWLAERMGQKEKNVREMKITDALFVGLCQGIAIVPGISRSGATIVGSLFSGLNRQLAVRFAFLISLPAILGAVILEAPAAFSEGLDRQMLLIVAAGVATAAISGYIAIKTMIRVVSNKKLYIFSFYTWIAGGLVLLYTFMS